MVLYTGSVRFLVAFACLAAVAALGGCHPGGVYAGDPGAFHDLDRGHTNGRQFDFVTNKPDGDDWQIRIRGSALWAAYSKGDKSDQLGTANLTPKEMKKVWKMIDDLGLDDRDKGKQDPDEGYVTLRLREPGLGVDDPAEIHTVYVSRDEPGDDVTDLAIYLQDLVSKYFKEKPNF